jgi:hypothetical protein
MTAMDGVLLARVAQQIRAGQPLQRADRGTRSGTQRQAGTSKQEVAGGQVGRDTFWSTMMISAVSVRRCELTWVSVPT